MLKLKAKLYKLVAKNQMQVKAKEDNEDGTTRHID